MKRVKIRSAECSDAGGVTSASRSNSSKGRHIRDSWGSRLGIIMAVSGSALGLGNFLRFPAKVASNGGGAFMIPYFVSLFLLGIPLMWIEWTLGRYGGGFEHSSAPGIFHSIWQKNRFIKYFGVIGIFGPLIIFIYYIYIASWTLAYSFFALFGKYSQALDQATMQSFLRGFQGLERNQYFNGLGCAYLFFLITFLLNIGVIYYGIRRGIERLCKFAMPLLFICALVLMIRVVTLGIPDLARPSWNISNGFGFFWNPDFSALKSARVWLEAAGQIFFTLSVGIGVILTYASYLSRGDDVALSGLTAASTNEFAEVILGGSIIIPAAFVFFGPLDIQSIARSGVFNLGFVTMPLVLNKLPLAEMFGFLWFFLLFLAGITSSVSLAQPAVAFLEDEFNINRRKAVLIFGIGSFILCHAAILFLKNGVVDELDFWGGTFFLVLFATIEVILFAWIFGMENAWDEIHKGADMRVPRIYKFIIKYITPLFLFFILGMWFWQEWVSIILMKNVSLANRPFILGTRIGIVSIFLILALLVKIAWRQKRIQAERIR
ncbi:MAG: sodium-dependent transporter [Candidatus Omnitrophica bacterium]|nr:sodium-dependent transporter [Candidatus Omnitrophota bacterium]MBU4473131.1 sodium-dependent transporter [Candidatus Omnitrophota bacterium]MCG2706349.1 sodium-dependent transporter [Candidatus Omnitrophota bacterium]